MEEDHQLKKKEYELKAIFIQEMLLKMKDFPAGLVNLIAPFP